MFLAFICTAIVFSGQEVKPSDYMCSPATEDMAEAIVQSCIHDPVINCTVSRVEKEYDSKGKQVKLGTSSTNTRVGTYVITMRRLDGEPEPKPASKTKADTRV